MAKKCISSLISEEQSGFLPGRNIGSNIRLLLDVIAVSNDEDMPGLIVLMDIEKAFDSVNHQLLFLTLGKMNLGETFLQWVKTFYKNRQLYIYNNGHRSQPINMKNGVFQGCPISPYLFLIVMEILTSLIKNNDKIEGIPILGENIKLSLFADDTTVYTKANKPSLDAIFETMDRLGNIRVVI